MFKNLPDTLLIERSMMHRMETSGAVLQYLPQFLQTLARTKESAPSLEGFEADLKRQEKVQRQEMAKSIEWITEKIDKLKMSPYAKHPLVEHTIERAERSKDSKDNLPPAILLSSIIVNLQFAVSAVAAFGNDPLFEGWVELGIAKIDPKGIAPKFPKNSKGLIPVENRWGLAEQIGHGVDCWQVSPLSIGPNGKQSTPPAVYLLYGCFEKFIFPSSVDSVFALSKDIREWREKRNTDPATLLSFLKILSQYEASKKLSKPLFLRAKTVLEAEKLCIEGEIRPYLRQFSSTNSEDHPLSRSQLLNLIDTFLNMLDINITRTIAKRKEAKQSIQAAAPNFDVRVRDKEIAVEWMRKEWAQDDRLSQDTIIDRLVLAILQNRIELEKDYKRSTFEKWVDEADPLPKAEREYRPKTKNRKNG